MLINYQDILVSLGFFDEKQHLGLEGSGIVRRVGPRVTDYAPGDRVALFHLGLFQTHITNPRHCYKVPDGISLEGAATMQAVYATAMYSLIEVGALKKGQVGRLFLTPTNNRR